MDLYPNNPSMVEEIRRLFSTQMQDFASYEEMIERDFKKNGVEREFIPMGVMNIESKINFPLAEEFRRGECVFCRNNGEQEHFYKSHILKDRYGKVTCPVLRAYTCPICGTSGDAAHTIKYCPINKKENILPSVTHLKSVMRTSTGKRRGRN